MTSGVIFKLNKEPIKRHSIDIIANILLVVAIAVLAFWVGRSKVVTEIVYIDSCDCYPKTVLNWENIDYWMDYFNVEYKDIVKAQIRLETGNLTSDNCVKNNNLFGMMYNDRTATYKANGYAGYSSYIESIKCYSMWQHKYYNGTDNYYDFLRKIGYATDSLYIQKLKTIVYEK